MSLKEAFTKYIINKQMNTMRKLLLVFFIIRLQLIVEGIKNSTKKLFESHGLGGDGYNNFADRCQPTDRGPIGCNMISSKHAACYGKKSDKTPNRCVCNPFYAFPSSSPNVTDTTKCLPICSGYPCEGYLGDQVVCIGADICGDQGDCHGANGVGNYYCRCNVGYKFNGIKCIVDTKCKDDKDFFCEHAQQCIPQIYRCEDNSKCDEMNDNGNCKWCDPTDKFGCNMTSSDFVKCFRGVNSSIPNLCICHNDSAYAISKPGHEDRSICLSKCVNGACGKHGGVCYGAWGINNYYCECPVGRIFEEHTCVVDAPCRDENNYYCEDLKRCIPMKYRCNDDLTDGCGDGSDEDECYHVNNTHTWHCGDGTFVMKSFVCDLEKDCNNNADEIYCATSTCNDDEFRCNRTGICIPNKDVCDTKVDCSDDEESDRSDEENCEFPDCKEDEFKCESGICIPLSKKCDGLSQCLPHRTDEKNCTEVICPEGNYQCINSRKCIEERWGCDGYEDCIDGSDEYPAVCDGTTCRPDQFTCTWVAQCISGLFYCDGQNDCMDKTDEKDCQYHLQAPRECNEYQFQCNHFDGNSDIAGECIPKALRCDGRKHCNDNSDEANCTSIHDHCEEELLYTDCNDGKGCYHNKVRCNGVKNCLNGEDEKGCPFKCKPGLVRCGDSTDCISEWKLCDKEPDCPNKWDESPSCDINECEAMENLCEHKCIDLKIGYKCECQSGFELAEDGINCIDVNECEIIGRCSQLCENHKGGYKCSCKLHYDLVNQTFCRSKDVDLDAVFIENRMLHYKNLKVSSDPKKLILEQTRVHISGIASTYYLKDLYYSTLRYSRHKSKIFKISVANSSYSQVIITEDSGSIIDIDYDWINKKLYWLDDVKCSIGLSEKDGTYQMTLITNLKNPTSFVIDPTQNEKYVYWLELHNKTTINRISMDGNPVTRETILTLTNSCVPKNLVMDYSTTHIYWFDIFSSTIQSYDVNRKHRRVIYELTKGYEPVGLSVFEDYVYWSNHSGIYRVNKFTRKMFEILLSDLYNVQDLLIYNKLRQPYSDNPCKESRHFCSHLCLLAHPNNYTCACPDGLSLLHDGVTCNTSEAYNCDETLCQAGGKCYNVTEEGRQILPRCRCPRGYGGKICDEAADILKAEYKHGKLERYRCVGDYCLNDGICMEKDYHGRALFKPICSCPSFYWGRRCQHRTKQPMVVQPVIVESVKQKKVGVYDEPKQVNIYEMVVIIIGIVLGFVVLTISGYGIVRYIWFNRAIRESSAENESPRRDRVIYMNPVYRPTTTDYNDYTIDEPQIIY